MATWIDFRESFISDYGQKIENSYGQDKLVNTSNAILHFMYRTYNVRPIGDREPVLYIVLNNMIYPTCICRNVYVIIDVI